MDNELLKNVLHIFHQILDVIRRLSVALGKLFRSSSGKATMAAVGEEEVRGKWSKRALSIGFTSLVVFLGVALVTGGGGLLLISNDPYQSNQIGDNSFPANQSTPNTGKLGANVPFTLLLITKVPGYIGTYPVATASNFEYINNQTIISNQTVPVINTLTTTYTNVNNLSTYGFPVDLVANVIDDMGNAINSGSVDFTVNNENTGSATVKNGTATITQWTVPSNMSWGSYPIIANYTGTSNYSSSTGTGTLTYYAS